MKRFTDFARRYWLLIVGFLVALWVSRTETAFDWVGTIVHLPAYGLGAILSALGFRHVFLPQTLDEDARSGYFTKEWKALDPKTRVLANLAVMAAFFLGMCWIAAAMIR